MTKKGSTQLGFMVMGVGLGILLNEMLSPRRTVIVRRRSDFPESEPLQSESHHDLAWKGTWDRPMKVDEQSLDRLTSARMTDHNSR
jgi:hypothetical protein